MMSTRISPHRRQTTSQWPHQPQVTCTAAALRHPREKGGMDEGRLGHHLSSPAAQPSEHPFSPHQPLLRSLLLLIVFIIIVFIRLFFIISMYIS